MMKLFILPPDRSTIYIPIVTHFDWETHRKGKVGTVRATFLNPHELKCELGSYLEVWIISPQERKRIIKYKVYERTLNHHELHVVAYDQMYVWVKSKEYLITGKANANKIKHLYNQSVHIDAKQYSLEDKNKIKNHWTYVKECTYRGRDDEVKNGIFTSDIILTFAASYHLEVDEIDYSDVPNYDNVMNLVYLNDFWGLPPKMSNNESVLDIIQYYIDYHTAIYSQIYILYDGGNGLCYKKIEDMNTYLYFTLDIIGNYEIKQQLPKDYYNFVDFRVQSQKVNVHGSSEYTFDPEEPFKDESKMSQLGIFYKVEIIGEISSYKEENGQKVVKTPNDVMRERRLYYEEMNKNLLSHIEILVLRDVKGSWSVRGGSLIKVEYYPFKKEKTAEILRVERVIHHYVSEENHTMDIELKGVYL